MMTKIPRYQTISLVQQDGYAIGEVMRQGKTIGSVQFGCHKHLVLDYKERRWAHGYSVQPFAWEYDWDAISDEIRKAQVT